jgi:hypothetical protein
MTDVLTLTGDVKILMDSFLMCSLKKSYVSNFLELKISDKYSEFGYRGKEVDGINTLRYLLLIDFVLALSKIFFDNDRRVVSIKKICDSLHQKEIQKQLLEDRKLGILQTFEFTETDGNTTFIKKQTDEMFSHYEQLFTDISLLYNSMKIDRNYLKIEQIRNKIAAHSEVLDNSGIRQNYSISDIGINWKETIRFYEDIKSITIKIYQIVTGSYYSLSNVYLHNDQLASSLTNHFK